MGIIRQAVTIKKEIIVEDVYHFNEAYLNALREAALINQSVAATRFNADLGQVAEWTESTIDTIKAISHSTTAVVKPLFTTADLVKRAAISNAEQGICSDLNYLFISMIRHIANRDVRLAKLATNASIDLCTALKSMSFQDIQACSKANTLMFRCSISQKTIEKANATAKNMGGDTGKHHYFGYLPLMSKN